MITVGQVAEQVLRDEQLGDAKLLLDERACNERLRTDPQYREVLVEGELSGRAMAALRERLMAGSDYYWEHFRRAAIVLKLRQAPGPFVIFACPRDDDGPAQE